MPVVNVDYDDAVVSEDDIRSLAEALQKIVSEATAIDDVNVYASTAYIKVHVLPVEVFIRMSARFVEDESLLVKAISERLREWKVGSGFPHLINIYLIPMQWTVASDI